MSNLKHETGKPRLIKLLFVVLMMSVGLNLLLGCGKSNKGQVVGPAPCKENCDEDKKPFSGNLWETALGRVDYMGGFFNEPAMIIALGLDFYASGGAKAQAIVPTPVGSELEVEGALWVDQLQLFCGYEYTYGDFKPKFESIPAGEYLVSKNVKRGSVAYNGFRGNVFEVKKGKVTLKIEMLGDYGSPMKLIPGYGIKYKGYDFDNYMFGQIKISNSNGCFATPWVSAEPVVFPFKMYGN